MALTFTQKKRVVAGNSKRNIYDITLDNSYPSGGWSVTAGNFGLTRIDWLRVPGVKDGYLIEFDVTNSKIKVYQGDNANVASAPAVELANASSVMNTKVIRVEAVGDISNG